MKIDKNFKNGLPVIVFENSDISNLAKVEEMFLGMFRCHKCGMEYENKGWKIFKDYLECERLKLQTMLKLSVSLNKVSESDTKVEVAKLVGFDHFLEMEDKIKAKLEKLRENSKEIDNGSDESE